MPTQGSQKASVWTLSGGIVACVAMAAGAYWLSPGTPSPDASVKVPTPKTKPESDIKGGSSEKVEHKIIQKVFGDAWRKVLLTGKIDSDTLNYFMRLSPEKQEIESRILISKFFTLYIQVKDDTTGKMSASQRIPPAKDMELCNKWLRYEIKEDFSDDLIGETINSRTRLAYLSQDISQIEALFEEAKKLRKPSQVTTGPHTYLYQRLFQMSCILGYWDEAEKYGNTVARFSEIREGRPLNVMHRYYMEAMKAPSKSFNYVEIFRKVSLFKDTFDRNLNPPLKFLSMDILKFETKLVEIDGLIGDKTGSDFLPENSQWKDRYQMPSLSLERRKVWVFGAMCQLFCPASRITFLLAGPLNDTQMRLTGQTTIQHKIPPDGASVLQQKNPADGTANLVGQQIRICLILEIEKKSSKTEDGKQCWLWEGVLEVPRFKRTGYQDPETKQEKFRYDQIYKEKYEVRMSIL